MSDQNIRLSIIVTVFNREKYIRRCLDSLLAQDISDEEYEIVVVDDGSTDLSGTIIDEYSSLHKNLHVFHKDNCGVADTRNKGLELAKGNYITYVDSDDFVEKNSYGFFLKLAERKKCDILVCDYYKSYEKCKDYVENADFLKEGFISPAEYILMTPSPCNKLMKKELFMRGNIRFPFGIFYEDYATIPLLANEAKIIYYVKKAYLNYFQENESITRNIGYQKKWWDMYTATQNLNKLKPIFHQELEFIVYLYLVVRTSSWYLQVGNLEKVEIIAEYFKQKFPHWKKNAYIKQRPVKERMIARLVCLNEGKIIIDFMNLKKRMKHYVKKN